MAKRRSPGESVASIPEREISSFLRNRDLHDSEVLSRTDRDDGHKILGFIIEQWNSSWFLNHVLTGHCIPIWRNEESVPTFSAT
jgi:hypothetical protein